MHGVLLLDKPLGWTSNDALQKAKGLLRAREGRPHRHAGPAGHRAAAAVLRCRHQVQPGQPGRRQAPTARRCRLGERSSTRDGEGEITPGTAVAFDRAALDAACRGFHWPDRPAAADALGAEEGRPRAVRLRPRRASRSSARRAAVTIHRLDIVDWQHDQLVIDVACSKGTYIRTLADDLGDRSGLRRLAAGPAPHRPPGGLSVDDAITHRGAGRAAARPSARPCLLPPDALLAALAGAAPARRRSRPLPDRPAPPRRRADRSQVRVYASTPPPLAATGGPNPRAFLGSAHITGRRTDRRPPPQPASKCRRRR